MGSAIFSAIILTFGLTSLFAQYCPSSGPFFNATSNQYLLNLLNPTLNTLVNPWDNPTSLSQATVAGPVNIQTVSLADLKYYNYFAASVYCPYTVANLTCCYCQFFNSTVTEYKLFENGFYGTKALVTVHNSTKNEIVVTFRGSVSLMNWLMDALLINVDTNSNIKLHRGAYLSTMSLYNDVVQYVGQMLTKYPNYRVVITGHSLGGSMASLFTFFLNYLNQFSQFNPKYVLISVAQFRVGNRYYADYMNALSIPMVRLVNRADIAAHVSPVNYYGLGLLPFSNPNYYVHHAQEVWINGTNVTYCTKARYEDKDCSYSQGPGYTIVDHGQYFGVDYFNCYFVEGYGDADVLTLPPTGWKPTDYMPPMPTKIEDFFGPLEEEGYQGLYPIIG